MKKNKIIPTITKILVVILISLIAFIGIYVQKTNRMENVIKDYKYNMDLEGRRVLSLKVNDEKETIIKDAEGKKVEEELSDEEISQKGYTKEEIPNNKEEVLTLENYEKSKEIIEKRLKELKVNNYIIRLEETTGTIYLELPEDNNIDHTISNISEVGKFEIQDAETEEVLISNNQLKNADVLYNTDTTGTTVYLSIELNKEGKEKLNEISRTYVKTEVEKEENTPEEQKTEENATEDQKTEETETKTETVEKKISLKIDGSEMLSTSFEDPIENGTIQLSMGQSTSDKETLNDTIEKASTIATLLDKGNLPIKYKLDENKYVATDLTWDVLQKVAIVAGLILVIALIVLILKYKFKGLLASISFIGFIAVCTLIIRYTNVIVTLNSLVSMFIVVLLNYIFNVIILNTLKKEKSINNVIKQSFKEFFIKMIPVVIISIAFSFVSWIPISSFGMTMVWGLAIIALYNIIITRSFLK